MRRWKTKIPLEVVFWKLDLVDKAGEDEVGKVLCPELLLKAARSSLSCFAEAESAKAFLVQDDHKDQANKIYWLEAPQARVPKQFVKAHCCQQAR